MKNSISKIFRDYFNRIVGDVNPELSFLTCLAVCILVLPIIGMICLLLGWWAFPVIALTIVVVGSIICYRAINSKESK